MYTVNQDYIQFVVYTRIWSELCQVVSHRVAESIYVYDEKNVHSSVKTVKVKLLSELKEYARGWICVGLAFNRNRTFVKTYHASKFGILSY